MATEETPLEGVWKWKEKEWNNSFGLGFRDSETSGFFAMLPGCFL